MNTNGWIKIHRKIKDKGFWKNSKYVHLWFHLLLSANHKGKEFMWNKKTIEVKPGQVLTGRKQLSGETGLKPSTIENILNYFETEHQIEQQKTTKFRLITITNWDKHQTDEQQNEQQSDNKVTTDGHKQEVKKLKNEKKRTNTYSVEFETFWQLYPRTGASKYKSYQSWEKAIKIVKPEVILTGLNKNLSFLQEQANKDNGNFCPHPTTWLNQRRWENDTAGTKQSNGSTLEADTITPE